MCDKSLLAVTSVKQKQKQKCKQPFLCPLQLEFLTCPIPCVSCRSKGSTLAKRPSKKGEDPWNVEMPLGTEELDRTRKILQWMMEGEKEAGRYKKSPYG